MAATVNQCAKAILLSTNPTQCEAPSPVTSAVVRRPAHTPSGAEPLHAAVGPGAPVHLTTSIVLTSTDVGKATCMGTAPTADEESLQAAGNIHEASMTAGAPAPQGRDAAPEIVAAAPMMATSAIPAQGEAAVPGSRKEMFEATKQQSSAAGAMLPTASSSSKLLLETPQSDGAVVGQPAHQQNAPGDDAANNATTATTGVVAAPQYTAAADQYSTLKPPEDLFSDTTAVAAGTMLYTGPAISSGSGIRVEDAGPSSYSSETAEQRATMRTDAATEAATIMRNHAPAPPSGEEKPDVVTVSAAVGGSFPGSQCTEEGDKGAIASAVTQRATAAKTDANTAAAGAAAAAAPPPPSLSRNESAVEAARSAAAMPEAPGAGRAAARGEGRGAAAPIGTQIPTEATTEVVAAAAPPSPPPPVGNESAVVGVVAISVATTREAPGPGRSAEDEDRAAAALITTQTATATTMDSDTASAPPQALGTESAVIGAAGVAAATREAAALEEALDGERGCSESAVTVARGMPPASIRSVRIDTCNLTAHNKVAAREYLTTMCLTGNTLAAAQYTRSAERRDEKELLSSDGSSTSSSSSSNEESEEEEAEQSLIASQGNQNGGSRTTSEMRQGGETDRLQALRASLTQDLVIDGDTEIDDLLVAAHVAQTETLLLEKQQKAGDLSSIVEQLMRGVAGRVGHAAGAGAAAKRLRRCSSSGLLQAATAAAEKNDTEESKATIVPDAEITEESTAKGRGAAIAGERRRHEERRQLTDDGEPDDEDEEDDDAFTSSVDALLKSEEHFRRRLLPHPQAASSVAEPLRKAQLHLSLASTGAPAQPQEQQQEKHKHKFTENKEQQGQQQEPRQQQQQMMMMMHASQETSMRQQSSDTQQERRTLQQQRLSFKQQQHRDCCAIEASSTHIYDRDEDDKAADITGIKHHPAPCVDISPSSISSSSSTVDEAGRQEGSEAGGRSPAADKGVEGSGRVGRAKKEEKDSSTPSSSSIPSSSSNSTSSDSGSGNSSNTNNSNSSRTNISSNSGSASVSDFAACSVDAVLNYMKEVDDLMTLISGKKREEQKNERSQQQQLTEQHQDQEEEEEEQDEEIEEEEEETAEGHDKMGSAEKETAQSLWGGIQPVRVEGLPRVVPAECPVQECGVVHAVVDNMVVVKSLEGSNPLDLGSVLCFADRLVLGAVSDTFGPVTAPFYVVCLQHQEPAATAAPGEEPCSSTSAEDASLWKTLRDRLANRTEGEKVFCDVLHASFLRGQYGQIPPYLKSQGPRLPRSARGSMAGSDSSSNFDTSEDETFAADNASQASGRSAASSRSDNRGNRRPSVCSNVSHRSGSSSMTRQQRLQLLRAVATKHLSSTAPPSLVEYYADAGKDESADDGIAHAAEPRTVWPTSAVMAAAAAEQTNAASTSNIISHQRKSGRVMRGAPEATNQQRRQQHQQMQSQQQQQLGKSHGCAVAGDVNNSSQRGRRDNANKGGRQVKSLEEQNLRSQVHMLQRQLKQQQQQLMQQQQLLRQQQQHTDVQANGQQLANCNTTSSSKRSRGRTRRLSKGDGKKLSQPQPAKPSEICGVRPQHQQVVHQQPQLQPVSPAQDFSRSFPGTLSNAAPPPPPPPNVGMGIATVKREQQHLQQQEVSMPEQQLCAVAAGRLAMPTPQNLTPGPYTQQQHVLTLQQQQTLQQQPHQQQPHQQQFNQQQLHQQRGLQQQQQPRQQQQQLHQRPQLRQQQPHQQQLQQQLYQQLPVQTLAPDPGVWLQRQAVEDGRVKLEHGGTVGEQQQMPISSGDAHQRLEVTEAWKPQHLTNQVQHIPARGMVSVMPHATLPPWQPGIQSQPLPPPPPAASLACPLQPFVNRPPALQQLQPHGSGSMISPHQLPQVCVGPVMMAPPFVSSPRQALRRPPGTQKT